ncbi:RNase P and RNase MRP subunit [Neurospora sp. IMI 360204]|nr:RNase P and RNase MRP subunit [Neurospora sp. IMI 360204]
MDRKKIVHRLDTPFSAVEWPQISQEDQDAILELICQYRRTFVTPSKGKRKRKLTEQQGDAKTPQVPPAPELAAYVDVGFSTISRNLQHLSAVAISKETEEAKGGEHDEKVSRGSKKAPYSIIFVARSGQSSAFNCHFPQMVAVASKSQAKEEKMRLVGFSKSCEERLAAALGIPRVSSVALRADAPQAKGLVDFVREHVAPIEVAWLQEAGSGKFLETNIEAVPTKIGSKKTKSS